MLVNLHVKNLALIEEENIDFGEKLNILSGETGAGKSIILGSINAALGGKTSPDFIRSGCDYGLAEITFAIPKDKIKAVEEAGVLSCEDGELVISRKIMAARSQFKVNGQSFTAAQTRQLAAVLIDIHGQHDNQMLMDENTHLGVVDEYGGDALRPYIEAYSADYKDYTACKKALGELSADEGERVKEMAFLRYEIDEIEAAGLKNGEDVSIEAEYRKMSNYRKIADDLSEAVMLLTEGGSNISDMSGRVCRSLAHAREYDEALADCCDVMTDADNLISDVVRSLSSYMDGFVFDGERFTELENRLDLINSLKAKYGGSIEDIIESLENKKAKLEEYNNYDELLAKRQSDFDRARKNLAKSGEELSNRRRQIADAFSSDICKALGELNFQDVSFRVEFTEKEPSANGIDAVRFMISTNAGEGEKPLAKIASGGELSRIMLALKSVMADYDDAKTLIFDEIDAGISGKTAQKVAEKLKRLSMLHQIICITHLPQIAAMADTHYAIEKQSKDNRTISSIRELTYDESVQELARMLGGSDITQAVLSNAQELKSLANKSTE